MAITDLDSIFRAGEPWPPTSEAARLQAYERYSKLYEGDHDAVFQDVNPKELARVATGDTVYILDEPTTGLHFSDIQNLLDVLHLLTDAGNTVIVIEHNIDVIKVADWVIDLGPEGGAAGGQIMAEGAPEVVAAVEGSHTAALLRKALSAAGKGA